MTHINLELVEEIREINDGMHRVYFKSGRDILVDNGEELMNYWFWNHQQWPKGNIPQQRYESTGPG